jgi:hypothetical protein
MWDLPYNEGFQYAGSFTLPSEEWLLASKLLYTIFLLQETNLIAFNSYLPCWSLYIKKKLKTDDYFYNKGNRKTKMCLLIKGNTVKRCGRVDIWFHHSVWAQDGDERWVPPIGRFNLWETHTPTGQETKWAPESLWRLWRKQISCHCREPNPIFHTTARRNTYWAISAL